MADQMLLEDYLTPAVLDGAPPSPFLPGTNIQYAWDSTSLGLLKTCARLYQLVMVEGWASRDESIHLRFGIEYHAALEQFDHLLAAGHSRDTALGLIIQTVHERTFGWHPDPDSKAGKYKNPGSLIGLLVDYVDHFADDPTQIYLLDSGKPAVELSFRFELPWGPEAGKGIHWEEDGVHEHAQPYLLSGHLDRVVEFNDQLLVMDRKTTTTTLGPYYFSQYEPHNQMTLYTIAGRILLQAPIRGVIIDAAQIKLEEPNAFARGFTFRTEDQLTEWLDDLRTWLTLAEAFANSNSWPMNDTACDKFGGCKFRGICNKSPSVRERFLKTDFTKLEIEDRWNPLKPR